MKNYSRQRDEVIKVISQIEKHSTAEQIYLAVKKLDARISRSTVYRNLNELALTGKVCRFPVGCGNYRYEIINSENFHGHIVCSKCEKIEEIYDKEIEKSCLVTENTANFKKNEFLYPVFIGICSSCKSSEKC